MATTTGPDLSSGIEAIEALMDDECLITRDESGVDDAVLDQDPMSATYGDLVQSVPNAKYEGPCKIKAPAGLSNRPQEQGGVIYTQGEYELGLPITYLTANPDAEPAEGDWVLILSTRRDPGMVGKKFKCLKPVYSTMAIQRKVPLEYRG